jgi:predicted dehydrogenase
MLRVGIVGFGFMGRMHYRCWESTAGAEVAAICDADPEIIKKTGQAGGNIEGAEENIDFSNLKVFSDFDQMLAEANLDAVSITLPTHLHCAFSIKALSAGVHVLCEKPMALDAVQCQKMIDAAGDSGKILQIGHCIRFWPEYAKAKEIVDSGEYGKVIAATFQRLGSAPSWGDNWFADDDLSGGMALDLHIHDSDFVQYLFGVPVEVSSFSNPASGKGLKHIISRYSYGDDKLVTAEGSWAMPQSFGFQMSFNIVLEKATIVYDCSRQVPFRVCPADGEVFTPEVAKGDGYSRQIEHFAGRINGEDMPEVITLEQSANSIRIVRAEIESAQKGSDIAI